MWTRYLTTAPMGVVMTLALLYSMQALIANGEDAYLTAPTLPELTIYHAEDESEIQTIKPRPKRLPPPATPPELKPPVSETSGSGISVPRAPGAIYIPGGDTLTALAPTDGPLVAIVRVAPQYPASLATRGIDGFAIVQFDVSADGTVNNVRLVEASHPAFAKPAISAAERFRYKARVVDGMPIATAGLSVRFRFAME